MELLVVRHAAAEEAGPDLSDEARALTPAGIKSFKKAARGLAEIAPPITLIATSPLLRARQTAELLGKALGVRKIEALDALKPGRRASALGDSPHFNPNSTVAVVGHEPHLSRLAGYFLTGEEASVLELKKGGAFLIAFAGAPEPGSGRLVWALKPSILRRLGKS